MRIGSKMQCLSLFAVALGLLVVTGCGQMETDTESVSGTTEVTREHTDDGHDHDGGHNLHGYWCVEHGVPEEVCALCDTRLAADFQKKGDWCEEHNRPDSQCFDCNPEAEQKFIAQYEAKFGEKPPTRHGE